MKIRRLSFLILPIFLLCTFTPISLAAQESTAEAEPAPGTTRTDARGVEQVWVPPGCFQMGTSTEQAETALVDAPAWAARYIAAEQPRHEVCLTAGYWIDRTEVTNAAYQAFVEDGGYRDQSYWSEAGWAWLGRRNSDNLPRNCVEDATDTQPRVCITWFEAEAYARWRGGSLPSEAQWEYAARGTESRLYPWGDEWIEANAHVVGATEPAPVGSYPAGASWVGAQDMAGNAMEWVADWLSADYADAERDDPTGAPRGTMKVEKGGWWGSNPFVSRAAYRHFEDPPTYQDHPIGMRVASPADAPVVE